MFSNKLNCVYTLYAYTNSMDFYDNNKTWITIRQPRKKKHFVKVEFCLCYFKISHITTIAWGTPFSKISNMVNGV